MAAADSELAADEDIEASGSSMENETLAALGHAEEGHRDFLRTTTGSLRTPLVRSASAVDPVFEPAASWQ